MDDVAEQQVQMFTQQQAPLKTANETLMAIVAEANTAHDLPFDANSKKAQSWYGKGMLLYPTSLTDLILDHGVQLEVFKS